MRAVIYARFSSDRQTEMSIDAQVRACREYADRNEINIIDVYSDEAISGTTNKRPQYQQMLSDGIENKYDMILIHKYDRIARDLTEQVNLQSKLKSLNIKLIAVAQDYGEGKDANLTKGIQWVLGEYYSANLSEETKKGHKETALKGLHNGGVPPFGYDVVDQRYVINNLEAEYVRQMFNLCIAGGSYSELIRHMDELGITGKRGKPIKYSQIYEILHNEKYTGVYTYSLNEEPVRAERRSKPNAIRIDGAIPAIISKEEYNKAQAVLSGRKRQTSVKHRCSGLVYCECGAKMHLNRSTRKGHTYERFICSKQCGAKTILADAVDEAVDQYLAAIFSDENMTAIEDALIELRKYNKAQSRSFEEGRKAKIAKLETEITNIMNAMASGAFTDNYALCNEMITTKRKEIEALKAMKNEVTSDKTVRSWIENIISQNYAPGVFIDCINIKDDSIEIISNFDKVVGSLGCGGTINIYPATMFGRKYNRS